LLILMLCKFFILNRLNHDGINRADTFSDIGRKINMKTQNFNRKKINSHLVDRKRTRLSKDSPIIKPLSAKQTGNRAEKVLKEIEERFRLAFENANIGMALVDLQGRLTKVNHQMCEIFGYSQEELERMTVNDIAYPEDLNISPSFIQRATSGEIEYAHFEKRYFHKDGHIVWGQVSSSLVRDPQGVPQYFISHVQDITEHKRAEEALKEGERFLFDIFSSIQDGISILDKDMNIIRVNQAMERWYSHAMPLIGKKCYEAYHGRSERCEICPTYQTINTGKGAYEVVPKTGSDKKIVGWLDLYSFPLIDTVTGKMRGVIEYVRDISGQKQAEEELQRSEENTKRLALENATMAEIGRIISSTLDIEEVYERFVEEAHKLIPIQGIAINIINHKDGTVTVPYVSGIAVPGCQPGDVLPLEGSVTGEVTRTRSGLIIQTEDKNELQARFPTLLTAFDAGLRSVIAVPLISKDQAIGSIHFRSTKSNAYSNQDLKLAESIGFQIADAIANTQLFAERKQVEEKYRTILRTAMDGFWIVDMQGRFLDVNDAYCRMIGYSRDELLTMSISDVEVVERPEETARRIQKIMEVGGDRFETLHKCKDGRIIDIEVSVNYMEAGGGRMFVFIRDITGRKRAEEALRQTEEKYRDIFENAVEGIFQTTPKGHFISANPAFARINGFDSPEELISSTSNLGYELFVDPDRRAEFARLLRTQVNIQNFEFQSYRKDRSVIWATMNTRARRNSKGKLMYYEGTIQDITERKKGEEALRTEKQKLQTLSENAPFGMVMIDQEGTFKYMNPQFRELFGYNLSDVPDGRTWFRKAYPDPTYRHHVIAQWMKDLESFERGERIPRIFTAICKDGTKKTLNFVSVRLEKGEYLMTCEDITERKLAEENLRESEEKYRLLVEESLQGIVVAQGVPPRLVFANPAMTMILGYTFEELSSLSPKGIEGLVHPEDRAFFFKNYKDRLEGKSVLPRYEIRGIRKDGTVVWLELSSVRIEYKGQPAVQAAFLDITERKQAEEALRESEERYRTILGNIEDGYYEVDLLGNFTFFNDSLCRMLGYSRDEMIGMGNQQYTDQENRKKLFQAFNEVYRTGEPAKGFDWEVIRKDGAKVFGEISVSLIKDSKGQPIGFRGIARDITERKRAEEEIKHTLSLLNATLESTADGILVVDREGKIESFNQKFVQMWYIPESIIASQNDDQALAFVLDQLKNPEGFLAKVRELYNQPDAESFDFLEFKDGRVFERFSKPQRVGEQSVGRVWSFRDVTERKKAEESLGTEKQRFQTLSDQAPFGMVMIDQDGTFKYINPKFRELFGYDLTDIPDGKTWFRKAYPDPTYRHDVIEVWINDLKSSKPGEKRSRIFTVTCKDGTEKTINFIPVQLETGENLMACEDITERKRAEEALKKSEVRFQELFNDAPVGYFEYDVEGRIIDANRTELELLGYTLEEMIGQPVWKFIVEEEIARQQILEKLAGIMPPARGIERTYRRKDGTTLPVLIEDRILRDSEGRIIGIRTTIQDISELKRAEEEMRALEEQFRQSQKMEAVGRLGGGIAHDFNNLLTIIKGYSQLSLLDLKESDPLWGNIQEIQKATQRATDLTRQLLAFSRRQILDLKVLDMNALLRDLDKMLRRIIGEDIELTTLLAEDLGRVKIDPGQIEQVIFNLAVNARDAMLSGGKLIIETTNVDLDKEYARTHISVVPGRYVRLSVSDTGFGMSQEVREKVFEPFFTTKDKGKGTGLGLSTVYGIVKQSGGNIWVYSEPGHGTTFKIYLPRVEEELDTLHGQDETNSLPRGSETVLLVEDEPSVRNLAHHLLNQQGYKVLEAANGEEALRVAQEHIGEKIHLLLTDVVMPQMGGEELANQLKILRPDVKVLYTSGYTDNAIVHHGVLEPGTHFLQKPFSPKTLSHKVREVLDR
jgi:two-component system cell cycle sensor histidine kinase/response regulator CckA